MLRKKLLALILIPVGLGSVTLARADDGTINFIGTISAAACTVSSVAGSGATIGTVDFGQLSSATLKTAGSSTGAKPFTIELSDCAVTAAPDITFKGTAVSTENYTHLFTSQVPGIGIQLEDAGKTGTYYLPGVKTANTGFNELAEDVSSATGRFNAYLVAYSSGTPTGDIDTDVTFVIDYTNS
ncbi:fimbrial protein [Erwinia sp. 198]|uniref:fimbrial protein n=1 Tax=Erwinia sp. 198 TaxID=2022746 RepID=UPI000F680089|nr:fimbrial protein [Erwinia sp. 198]RRZ96977.1 type 1 fimbrial protein [Erwinia sp. 198]